MAKQPKSIHKSTAILLAAGLLHAAQGSRAIPKRILVLGDSLTAGYGICVDNAFPSLLEKELRQRGKNVDIINAGISGTTSASGLGRLRGLLNTNAHILILALGANDGLRGIPVESMRKNLSDTIELAQTHHMTVILAGMKIPSLDYYGRTYSPNFEQVFREVAAKFSVTLIPFLLEGVAREPSLNIGDGIHPNEQGHALMAKTVLPYLESLL